MVDIDDQAGIVALRPFVAGAKVLMAARAADIWAGNNGTAKSGQPTALVMLGLAVLP